MSMAPVELHVLPAANSPRTLAPQHADRDRLVRRAKTLAWIGVTWHGVEATIAVGAGLAASSIALVGFGADSLIEALAGFIVLWRFATARASSGAAERRAQQLIAISFYLIAAYITVEATPNACRRRSPRSQLGGDRTVRIHARNDAATGRRQGQGRRSTRLAGRQEREPPDHALRLPLSRTAHRPRPERARSAGGGPIPSPPS